VTSLGQVAFKDKQVEAAAEKLAALRKEIELAGTPSRSGNGWQAPCSQMINAPTSALLADCRHTVTGGPASTPQQTAAPFSEALAQAEEAARAAGPQCFLCASPFL